MSGLILLFVFGTMVFYLRQIHLNLNSIRDVVEIVTDFSDLEDELSSIKNSDT